MAGLHQLHIADACRQSAGQRLAGDDVPEKSLPSDTIGIRRIDRSRNFLPVAAVIETDINRWIDVPDVRRVARALRPATVHAGNRRTSGAVDLECQKIVAAYPHCPGADN